MEDIIIIPDSFKGSMTSIKVSDIIEESIKKYVEINTVKIPIADGGEGSTDCILMTLGGEKISVKVKSPENVEINAYYGITKDRIAVIEIAESSGITKQTSFDAKNATTYGFGQLIKDALDKGCRKFLLCLGGSATTDCGFGMAVALGAEFYNALGESFLPVGGTLSEIANVSLDNIDNRINASEFIVMCDVDNPLYGERGAAYIYAPQKGATPLDVKILDTGLKHASFILEKKTGYNYTEVPGAGAAGGAGYGCMAFLDAKLKSGIEAMLEIVAFDKKKKSCKRIITGEGKIDEQSFMGKVLSGIKKHSESIPITAFCGISTLSDEEKKNSGIDIVEIGRGIPLEESITNGEKYLRIKAEIRIV